MSDACPVPRARRTGPAGRIVALAALWLWSATAVAVEQIELSWGAIDSGDWHVQGGVATIDWSQPGQTALTVELRTLEIGDRRIENISLHCENADVDALSVNCPHGRFSMRSDWLNARAAPASLRYQVLTRELTVSIAGLALAGGELRLTFHHAENGWQLDGKLVETSLAGLAQVLEAAGVASGGLTYQGRIDGGFDLRGSAAGLTGLGWQLQVQDGGYSNAQGSQAAEALTLVSRGSAVPGQGDWRIQGTLGVKRGMLYSDPLYLEFSENRPLDLAVELQRVAASGEVSIRSLSFAQPGVVEGTLSARLAPGDQTPLRQLAVDVGQARFPGLYTTWLQPWLAGTALARLDTAGRLQGHLEVADGRLQALQLQLHGLTLRDDNDQFAIQGLDGGLHWDSRTVQTSTLGWQSASVYRLAFGAAQLALETRADAVKLLAPLVVPLFDGQLHVDRFELEAGAGQPRWLLDAMLTPVSMRKVSTALGWPPFSGTLSGMIPRVSYEDGDLTLGGILLVQAFDGDITIRNLHVRDMLGRVPRLWADTRIDNLDLKPLTEAFSFGRIEGRLDGRVDDLYLEAWQPVAFDAAFGTPADDDSRHRISQRAVDNISNLGGGGMAGAVSRSFLRFLEDFPYRRLGIACRLANGVCHMDGAAPAERGYYLVQGRWLPPRLDVIGYAAEVDWLSLLARLRAINSGAGPVVR